MDQIAQDKLQALMNQRNAALNECVELASQVMATQRKIAELEKNAKQVQTHISSRNGHDAETRAQA